MKLQNSYWGYSHGHLYVWWPIFKVLSRLQHSVSYCREHWPLRYHVLLVGSDEGSDQEREWEEQQIRMGVSAIQQVQGTSPFICCSWIYGTQNPVVHIYINCCPECRSILSKSKGMQKKTVLIGLILPLLSKDMSLVFSYINFDIMSLRLQKPYAGLFILCKMHPLYPNKSNCNVRPWS